MSILAALAILLSYVGLVVAKAPRQYRQNLNYPADTAFSRTSLAWGGAVPPVLGLWVATVTSWGWIGGILMGVLTFAGLMIWTLFQMQTSAPPSRYVEGWLEYESSIRVGYTQAVRMHLYFSDDADLGNIESAQERETELREQGQPVFLSVDPRYSLDVRLSAAGASVVPSERVTLLTTETRASADWDVEFSTPGEKFLNISYSQSDGHREISSENFRVPVSVQHGVWRVVMAILAGLGLAVPLMLSL